MKKRLVLAGFVSGVFILVPTLSAQPFAYVASSTNHWVKVLDTSDNSIVDTIPVGMFPFSVAVSPDGSRVYVRNSNDTDLDTISVISAATNTVIDTVLIDSGSASALAMSPNGSRVYVSVWDLDVVLELDTATNTFVGTPITVGDRPDDLVVSPDGKYVYVSNSTGNSVSVIQAATRSVVATVTGTGLTSPDEIRVTPDGSKVIVLGLFGTVVLIDTSTRSVIDSIDLGSAFHQSLAISPDGSVAYFGHSPFDENTFDVLSDDITYIDVPSFSVAGTIPVASDGVPAGFSVFFTSMAFTPDGARVYVSMQNKNRMGVLDTATNTLLTEIPGLSPSVSGQFIVPAESFTGLIFRDGFESGDTGVWDG